MSTPEEEAGLVRAYVIAGRTDLSEAGRRVQLDTCVTASKQSLPPSATPEKQRIWKLVTDGALTVTEIAGYLRLPLGVVRALLSDMLRENYLVTRRTASAQDFDETLLKEVLNGLRRI